MTTSTTWPRVRSRDPVLLLGVALVLVQTVVRAWQVLPGEYWQDDFAQLSLVRGQPLTVDLVLADYNGHLMPVGSLALWVFAQAPGSYLPAALFILALQLMSSLVVLVLLRRLTRAHPGHLVGLALYLFCPVVIPAVSWWASFAITVPVQLAMAVAAWGHLRLVDTRQARWLAVSLGGLVLGLAFTEKAVLVPLFVVAVAVLDRPGSARAVIRGLARWWPVWAAHAVLVLAYLAAYRQLVELGDGRIRSVGSFVRLLGGQVGETFLVGAFGGPWQGGGSGTGSWPGVPVVVIVVLLETVLLFAVATWWWQGRWSLVPWAVLAGWLLVDVMITALGRGVWSDLIRTDPRYLVDAVLVLAVVVSVQLRPRTPPRHGADLWIRRHAPVLTCVAVAVVFNSSLVTVGALADANHRPEVTTYVGNVREALRDDPGLNLYDGAVPGAIMIPLFPDDARRVSSVLAAYDVEPRFDQPSETLQVLDDAGRPHPIRLAFGVSAALPASGGTCGARLETGVPETLALAEPLPPGHWVARLSYVARADGAVTIAPDDDPARAALAGLPSGAHSVDLVLDGALDDLEVTLDAGSASLCLTDLTIGFPVPAES